MKEELSNCLEILINNKPRLNTKSLAACFSYEHGKNLFSTRRKIWQKDWGDSLRWRETPSVDIFWTWLDCGEFIVERYEKSIFSKDEILEYINIEDFFADIQHPTEDEFDLLGVIHPWAPPAILLLGEGLKYLMKKGRCVKI